MSGFACPDSQKYRLAKIFAGCLLTLILFTVLLIACFSHLTYRGNYEKIFLFKTGIIYENRGRQAIWNLSEEDRAIGLFMNNSWQTAYLVNVSHPIERFDYDSDGNRIAVMKFTKNSIGLGGRVAYNFTFRLIFKQRFQPEISEKESGTLNDIPEDLKRVLCEPTGLWQSDSSTFRSITMEIAGNETRILSILKKLIRWMKINIAYASSEVPKYPDETLRERRGDCDDQANLLITFCRALGIPAYLQVGCIYIPNYNRSLAYWDRHLLIRQSQVGWHGWAMVYVPPWGWLPVDLTYVSGNLSVEPLDAVRGAAVIKHYTFQYMNITKADYVAETRAFKEFLEAYEFYIYEDEEMSEINVGEIMVTRKMIILATYTGLNVLFFFTEYV